LTQHQNDGTRVHIDTQAKASLADIFCRLVTTCHLATSSTVSGKAPSFTEVDIPLGLISYQAAVWADLDNDGDLDLLCPSQTRSDPVRTFLRLLRNDGSAGFTELATEIPGVTAGRYVVADIDRDGLLDVGLAGFELGISGAEEYRTQLFRNEGALRFNLVANGWTNVPSGPFEFGDVDRDGDLDLLHDPAIPARPGTLGPWAPTAPADFSVLQLNGGTGNFSPTPTHVLQPQLGPGRWLDVDADGELDVALTVNLLGPPYAVYRRNLGAPEFETIFRSDPSPTFGSLCWADLNGDGRLDVVVINRFGQAYVLFADADGDFMSPTSSLTVDQYWQVVFGDVDNDSDQDAFVSAGESNMITLLLNDGTGAFVVGASLYTGVGSTAAWADFDGDGDLDVVITAGCGGFPCLESRLHRNDSNVLNTPPTAPAHLETTRLANGDIRLAWEASTDAQTTNSKVLTYEVRVGTAPGRADVAMPPANLSTGWRKVAAEGSERTLFRLMRGLPPGTYYWSVQAVDSVWAGSAWAAESSFTITEPLGATRFERWMLRTEDSLELTFVAPPDFLAIVESALHLHETNWTVQTQLRMGPSGRETLVVPRIREAEFYRLRAIP
jgi:hypothetical protein